MRKTTLCLSILLAVAVTTTADAKKHRKHMAKPAATASKINGYAWPGMPYPATSSTLAQRDAFLGAAINPMGTK